MVRIATDRDGGSVYANTRDSTGHRQRTSARRVEVATRHIKGPDCLTAVLWLSHS